MIKINEKKYSASQVVDVHSNNEIPIQPVESGFDVQDHIRKEPLQVKVELLIFDDEVTLHGQWGCSRVDGHIECDELTGPAPDTGTYKYLMELRDNREVFLLDCSDYARQASMIYPDMAITHLGQLVQRGATYYCTVLFVQITRQVIVTEKLYIQETDTKNIRWSKEPIPPTTTESLTTVDETEDQPVIRRPPIEAMPSSIKPGGLVNNILEWCANLL